MIPNRKTAKRPTVWMGTYHPERLTTQKMDWRFLQRHMDGVELYINCVAYLTPQAELKAFARELKERNIQVSLQCGYFDWDPSIEVFTTPNPKGIADRVRTDLKPGVGRITAEIEMRKIEALTEMGVVPAVVALDGPVRRLLWPGQDAGRNERGLTDLDAAIDEVLLYIRTWRRRFPDTRFVKITNFPNWGWKGEPSYHGSGENGMQWGDFYEVIETFMRRVRRSRTPFHGLRIDNPYEYAVGTSPQHPVNDAVAQRLKQIDFMDRVLQLERYCRANNLEAELFVNAQHGDISAAKFREYTLKYLDEYVQRGGRPDAWFVESWYKHPEKVGPETDPESMAGITRDVIKRLWALGVPTARKR